MAKIKNLPVLPRKAWKLLRIAISDFKKISKRKDYVISMLQWHNPHKNGKTKCHVCLAGTVIAGTLQIPKETYVGPHNLPKGVAKKIIALDYLRVGSIGMGLDTLDIEWRLNQNVPRHKHVTSYSDDSKKFIKDLTAIADLLEKENL